MFISFVVGEQVHSIEASEELSLLDLKAIIGMEVDLIDDVCILYEGKELNDMSKTLGFYKVSDGALLKVTPRKINAPKPEPKAAEPKADSLGMMFDLEEQRRIEAAIQEANISANLQAALEHHPESFGSVHMLYVKLKINGVEVRAFVDCGAQTTIMTERCAERCGVGRLIDGRWRGVVQGVGKGEIVGRVHAVEVVMGGLHLACSLTIIRSENGEMPDMLLGLDMLRRHQACIDLHANCLIIHNARIPFLSEAESK